MFTESEIKSIRADFPVLKSQVYGHPLVYLDNAATTQKPQSVIDLEKEYYETYNANIHRGVHALSEKASQAYEDAREKVAKFINTPRASECIFTRNTTESINLIAQSYARNTLKAGDEVIVTEMDHHSNIVPWQVVCQQTGATLKVARIDHKGDLKIDKLNALLNNKTKIIALAHISNSLGTVNPLETIIPLIRQKTSAVIVIDGAQAIPHMAVDVKALDCDFYAFSGHKAFGPTGVGVLYGKQNLLDDMPPYQVGGGMVSHVTFDKPTYHKAPMKFEAGTPNIAGVIAFGAAIDYMQSIGFDKIHAHEMALLNAASEKMSCFENIKIIGQAQQKASVISFTHTLAHPHDICTIVDQQGVAVRGGTHCAVPAMEHFNLPSGTVRASFSFYNTMHEVEQFINALKEVENIFS